MAYGEPVSKANSTDTKNKSVQDLENEQDLAPPYLYNKNDIGILDWNSVKELALKQQQANSQRRKAVKTALEERALQLKNEHPQTTADKVALSKSHIDIANQYYFLKEYKEAAEEYENAAKFLKNIKKEKELYCSVVSSVQLCRGNQKKNDALQNQRR